MKLIILAAGIGKRMQPLTLEKPKPMLFVAGKPILERIIEAFPKECDEILLIIGYKGEQIKDYFGENFKGRRITYIKQPEATGTAHAMLLCKPFLTPNERFYVVYADDLHDPRAIAECMKYDRAMLVYRAEHPERMGVVTLNEKGDVIELIEKPEKPKTDLVSNGVFLLDMNIFKYTPEMVKGEFYLATMVGLMLKDFPIHAVHSNFWIPIGFPEDLQTAEKALQS